MRNQTLCETHTFENGIVEIHFDSDPTNPREDCEYLGKMICWHRNYDLGDRHDHKDSRDLWQDLATDIHRDFPNPREGIWDGVDEKLAEHQRRIIEKHFVILPLYLMDHSGISMSTGAFSCPWDSGQVGWIYVSMEKAKSELFESGATPSVEEIRTKATKALKQEVDTYDDYLTGQVYGFITYALDWDGEKGEELDSCWGFYGDTKYVLEEGKACLPTLDINREFDLAEAMLA